MAEKKAMLNYVTKEEAKQMACDMFKGCDDIYKLHMASIKEQFTHSKSLQQSREQLLQEMGSLAQIFRDQQMRNLYLMETIDEQLDKIFETK